MPVLTWSSLKPIIINPEFKISISYGVDEFGEVICLRSDIRIYYNGHPTRNGLNLKRWELIHLGRYISMMIKGTAEEIENIDELTITRTDSGDLLCQKRFAKLKIEAKYFDILDRLIPGIALIHEFIKDPLGKYPASLLQQACLFSKFVKGSDLNPLTDWKEEELLEPGKLTDEEKNIMKGKKDELHQFYSASFGMIDGLSTDLHSFEESISAGFDGNLADFAKENKITFRSLIIVIKMILG